MNQSVRKWEFTIDTPGKTILYSKKTLAPWHTIAQIKSMLEAKGKIIERIYCTTTDQLIYNEGEWQTPINISN